MGTWGDEFVNVDQAGPWTTAIPATPVFAGSGPYPDDTALIVAAVAWVAGRGGGYVYFPPGVHVLTTAAVPYPPLLVASQQPASPWDRSLLGFTVLTVPPSVTLVFAPGASLLLLGSANIEIAGAIDAGLQQIFFTDRWTWTYGPVSGNSNPVAATASQAPLPVGGGVIGNAALPLGRVLITGDRVPAVYPEWWGARGAGLLNDDDSDALQHAIDAAYTYRSFQSFNATIGTYSGPLVQRRPLPVILTSTYSVTRSLFVGSQGDVARVDPFYLRGELAVASEDGTPPEFAARSFALPATSAIPSVRATGAIAATASFTPVPQAPPPAPSVRFGIPRVPFGGNAILAVRDVSGFAMDGVSVDASYFASQCLNIEAISSAARHGYVRACSFANAARNLVHVGTQFVDPPVLRNLEAALFTPSIRRDTVDARYGSGLDGQFFRDIESAEPRTLDQMTRQTIPSFVNPVELPRTDAVGHRTVSAAMYPSTGDLSGLTFESCLYRAQSRGIWPGDADAPAPLGNPQATFDANVGFGDDRRSLRAPVPGRELGGLAVRSSVSDALALVGSAFVGFARTLVWAWNGAIVSRGCTFDNRYLPQPGEEPNSNRPAVCDVFIAMPPAEENRGPGGSNGPLTYPPLARLSLLQSDSRSTALVRTFDGVYAGGAPVRPMIRPSVVAASRHARQRGAGPDSVIWSNTTRLALVSDSLSSVRLEPTNPQPVVAETLGGSLGRVILARGSTLLRYRHQIGETLPTDGEFREEWLGSEFS